MCKVERVQEEGWSVPTPQHSLVRAVRLRLGLSLLGHAGESLNRRAVFRKGMRGVLESLLWSVLNAVHAPSPIEHFLSGQTLEWK